MASSLTSTTLAAAVAVGDSFVRLTSVAAALKDSVLFVDGEAMKIVADAIGSMVQVSRGWGGTKASAHASGSLIWANPSYCYSFDEPSGAASEANETYLPRIVPMTGAIFSVVNSKWAKVVDKGLPIALPGGATYTYTAAGAIQLAGGTYFINGTTLAMTLAAPDGNTPEGTVINLVAANASAHTVTYTAGFRGGATSDDVATFGGAIGDGMTLVNLGGAWRVVRSTNITLG